jgi:hypothetical protein
MSAHPVVSFASLRVLFGHQSVGGNVVEGVREILSGRNGARWPVIDVAEAAGAAGGFLAHGRVGRNGDPGSKTQEFCELLSGPLGGEVDVALHKYCYVDLDAASDVDALFESYRRSMAQLRMERQHIRIVHVTVPLVRVRTGVQAWLLTLLGRRSPRIADNARRELFNDRLRAEYGDSESLFDLAAIESGDGAPRSLRADYTEDGGHLNAAGRRDVATALLGLFSSIAARS